MRGAAMLIGFVGGCSVFGGIADDYSLRDEDAAGGGGAATTSTGGQPNGGSGGVGGDAGAGGDGGAGGGGGEGGEGGAPTTAAADWTSSFAAVYRFESPGMLGLDSTQQAPALTVGAGAVAQSGGSPEGQMSLLLGLGDTLSSDEPYFNAAAPMAIGGWVRVSSMPGQAKDVISKLSSPRGYALQITSSGLVCVGGNGVELLTAEAGTITPGLTLHLSCSFQTDGIHSFFDGEAGGENLSATSIDNPVSASFELGANNFNGTLDEVFVYRGTLAATSVKRIYACGIAGERCSCRGTAYADCGFGEATGCAGLPACNATAP